MKFFLLALINVSCLLANAQNIGIGTNSPAPSAMLHINSTAKGLLMPRLTSAQRAAIAAPANGLQVYDTNTNSFWYFNSSAWIELGAGGGGGGNWISSNDNISNTNTGNVGIGNSFPAFKLDVNGNGAFNGTSITYNFTSQDGFAFSGGALSLTTPYTGFENKVMLVEGSLLQTFIRRTDDPSISDFATDFYMNPLGGNIGMGTNNPFNDSKVTIQTAAYNATALTLTNPFHSAVFQAFVGGPGNGNAISLGTPGDMPLAFYTNSANRIFIAANGNVGIGTDNPTYKLSVKGNIRSTEVVVETGWADYVFNEDYKLKSLTEVEEFILNHKHLPNIPSAADIEKNGLNVGDVQRRMMEKIEELTIYVIELKKEMEVLRQKN